jgi:GT2 family glycosyltransferase
VSLTPQISVVIPHYQDLQRLDSCLTALGRQNCPPELFEVIVADNGSPAGQEAVAGVIAGRARLVVASERGAGPARNAGVKAALGSVIAFTDSDCLPEADWLSEGVRALSISDFVGGRIRVLADNPRHMTPTEAFEAVFAFDNQRYVTKKGFSVTANLFCTRKVFDKVGDFRVGVSEDVDWCRRARVAGFRIGYAPEAVIGHPARRTWLELRNKWHRLNLESYGLSVSQKWCRTRWFFRSCALPASAILHSPRIIFSRELVSAEQRIGAIVTLYRLRLWRLTDAFRLLMPAGPS